MPVWKFFLILALLSLLGKISHFWAVALENKLFNSSHSPKEK